MKEQCDKDGGYEAVHRGGQWHIYVKGFAVKIATFAPGVGKPDIDRIVNGANASTPSHAPRKQEPLAYAVMQPKGAEFDYLVFPDYGEAESHVADAEDEREIIPLFPPSAPSTTPQKPQETISAPALSSDTELLKMALGNTAACLGDALAIFNRVAGYEAFKNSAASATACSADAKDAARYRWLRHDSKELKTEQLKGQFVELYQGAALDEKIDKQMNNSPDGGKQADG